MIREKSLCYECKFRMHMWQNAMVSWSSNEAHIFWESQAQARSIYKTALLYCSSSQTFFAIQPFDINW